MRVEGRDYRTVWMEDGVVKMIDQQVLPHRFEIVDLSDHRETAQAIREMTVRGAPAIGLAGAYGLVQVLREAPETGPEREAYVQAGYQLLHDTRPTAQDLFFALDAVRDAAAAAGPEPGAQVEAALAEAVRFSDENAAACRRIGEAGASLINDGDRVLTHCNAGWLATADWGTALAPIYVAHRAGKKVRVFSDETRPRCQGAALTMWELMQEGVACELIADNAAGHFMRHGEVQLVITGADRIAANGDAANKIGTYEKAVLAHVNGIPFYIAAPRSTFDLACASGDDIPIEERDADELLFARGLTPCGNIRSVRLAPEGAAGRNPAFDVTPVKYISGFITESGIIDPTPEAIAAFCNKS